MNDREVRGRGLRSEKGARAESWRGNFTAYPDDRFFVSYPRSGDAELAVLMISFVRVICSALGQKKLPLREL